MNPTGNPPAEQPEGQAPSPQSFRLRAGNNSPITVNAPQAYASGGGTANANVNPSGTAGDAPAIPWWNRASVVWVAVGSVAGVVAAVAAILALYK